MEMDNNAKIIFYSAAMVAGIFFLAWGLVEAKGVLAPLTTATVLALVILPLAKWMEKKLQRGIVSLISTLALMIISLAFIAVLSYQTKVFAESWPEIKQTMQPKIEKWKTFVTENTFLVKDDLPTGDSLSLAKEGTKEGAPIVSMFERGAGYLGTYLLTFIYVFFILNYRRRFRTFLLRLFPNNEGEEVNKIVQESANVVQQYLTGKLILIALLAVIAGNALWGIIGMTLAIPVMAIMTIVFLHVPGLQPFGYLFSDKKADS